jgi:hypothetical protein
VIACEFESSNGLELSGVNAEEQSDIALTLEFAGGGNLSTSRRLDIFVFYDNIMIIRPGNVVDLIM